VKILIAHDLLAHLEGLRSLLDARPDMEVVGTGNDAGVLLSLATASPPDLLIVGAGAESEAFDPCLLIDQLRAQWSGLRTIALFRDANDHRLGRLCRHGIDGYVSEHGLIQYLQEAVDTVSRGQLYICPGMSAKVMGLLRDHLRGEEDFATSEIAPDLTSRQCEILKLLATGLAYKEIAQRLGLSPSTVETHCRRLRKKLGILSLSALRELPHRTGWLQ